MLYQLLLTLFSLIDNLEFYKTKCLEDSKLLLKVSWP